MGIGHHKTNQFLFSGSNRPHFLSHGGELRKKKLGRGYRPLSTKEPIHAVFKVDKLRLRRKSLRGLRSFQLVINLIQKYGKYFSIKVEQLSVQHDHIHILIRATRRSNFHHFFRVLSGQIAQCMQKEGLLEPMTDTPKDKNVRPKSIWKLRPFSRVVRGWKAYQIVRNYIQLNEKEVLGIIKYKKNRLKGLSSSEWKILWE